MMKAEDKIATARLALCRRWPYMATAVLTMTEIERDEVGTMAVDAKWRLYWCREFVDQLSVAEIEFVLAHEALHLVLAHHKRADRIIRKQTGPMHRLWNIAADLAVNSTLRNEGMPTPESAVVPALFGLPEDLAAEEYFQSLYERLKDQDHNKYDPNGIGEGKGSGSDGIPREWEESLEDSPLGDQKTEAGGAGGGSGAGPDDDSGSCGVDTHDQEAVIDKVVEDMAKARGDVPAGLKRLIQERQPAEVDPRTLLRRAIASRLRGAESGPGTSSYRRPARRAGIRGTLRPRQIKPCPRVAIIVDTSGSMAQSEIAQGLSLIGKTLAVLRSTDGIRVITGDVGACTSAQVFRADQVEFAGGGGTDMGAIIEAVVADREPTDLIIVVTDGYTPWPKTKPRIPCVACITHRGTKSDIPSWMHAVAI